MPRGYRCILIAIGWLALAAAAQPAQQQQESATAEQQQPPASYAPYANLSDEACYYAENHEAADLCAQWRAARAAEKAAEATETATTWSMVATILSGLALGALIWTLTQTEKALREARRGNEISEETARRELRAYVGVDDVQVFDFKPGGRPIFGLLITNDGQTPAYKLRSINIVRASDVGELYRIRIKGEVPGGISVSDLGPGRDVTHTNRSKGPLAAASYKAVKRGDVMMIFAGIITYCDAFGRPRRTIYRWHLDPSELDQFGNAHLTLCTKGNRSD